MIVYTVQMAKWRECKDRGIELIDTTVKSGDPHFSPTWDMVMGIKQGVISEQDYVEQYRLLMQNSYNNHRPHWEALCLREDPVAIACYCRAGKFCHRHLLLGFLKTICEHHSIPFNYRGEVE